MSRSRIVVVSSLAALAALVLVVWWFFFRDTSPPPPSLEGFTQSLEQESTTTVPPTQPAATETTGAPAAEAPAGEVPLDGSWTLSDDGASYVGYRVQEELASIGAKTAVGRTPLVDADLTIAGDAVTAVEVYADLTGLQSDDSRRDGAIRRQALETSTFPDARFSLTAPIELPAGAAAGEPMTATATGDLTLHGVTRPVEVQLEAQLLDGRIVVAGSAPILFADFDIDKPSAMVVVSVEDNGTMELLLVFERAG